MIPPNTPTNERGLAAFPYVVPLAAVFLMPHAETALSVSFFGPALVALVGWISRRRALAFHGAQALHVVASFTILSAFLGLVAHPDDLRWAGPLGSIPLDADAPLWARASCWIVGAARLLTLALLALRTARGANAALPVLSQVPLPHA